MVIWYKDPEVLVRRGEILKLWPQPGSRLDEKINSLTRLVILLSVAGIVLTRDWEKLLVAMIICVIAMAVLYKTMSKQTSEGMQDYNHIGAGTKGITLQPSVYDPQPAYNPKNPFNNTMVPEFGTKVADKQPIKEFESPTVLSDAVQSNAVSIFDPNSHKESESIIQKLFGSLGDNFTLHNSMRNYYSVPNRGATGDQSAFSEFCYGSMGSIKENGIFPL